MNIVLFSVIVVVIILIIVTLIDWLFDGIFGILELIRDWRNGDVEESAIIDPLPKPDINLTKKNLKDRPGPLEWQGNNEKIKENQKN